MMKRAAIYARVSTGKQAAGELSLPDQINQCRKFAEAKGLEIVAEFIDPGVSARTDKRPEFQRMITLACGPHRPFEVILVHSQSRLFRNAKDLHVYRDRLAIAAVRFLSATQDIGEGEAADIVSGVVGLFDEFQSKETAKHVSRSMIENARQGFWNGSSAPFGYRTYSAETRGARIKKRIEIDPQEAETVRQIFRLYVLGDGGSGPVGVKLIATRLNAESHRTRQGRPFRVQFVDTVLRNTAYVGEHYFNRNDSRQGKSRPREDWVPLPVPKIVDESLFYAAQDKLDRQHPLKTAPRLVRSEVLLTSVAKCGACGAPLRKLSGKRGTYHYYRCSKKFESGASACTGVSIPMGELDGLVLDAIEATALAPTRLRKLAEALASRAAVRNAALTARLRALDGERCKAKAQVAKLYSLIGSQALAMDATLAAHVKALQDKADALNRQIARLDAERAASLEHLTDEAIEAFGRAASAALRNPDNPAFARAYIQAVVSEVIVSDSEVRISGPKAALLHQAALFAANGELVPSFAQDWRTRSDKTANWRLPVRY
jgi:DNA invertase Pin-like site-specific DNA recombinase